MPIENEWTRKIEELKAQLVAAQEDENYFIVIPGRYKDVVERLAKAEGLLRKIGTWIAPPGHGHPLNDDIESFLANAPSDFVVVRREDAEQILAALEEETIEHINLKAALDQKEEKP
ncbi:MAG: hypothetical protein ACYDHZ_00525 [Dehalococcoidia bacterium]